MMPVFKSWTFSQEHNFSQSLCTLIATLNMVPCTPHPIHRTNFRHDKNWQYFCFLTLTYTYYQPKSNSQFLYRKGSSCSTPVSQLRTEMDYPSPNFIRPQLAKCDDVSVDENPKLTVRLHYNPGKYLI